MDETLRLIDQLIAEHRVIGEKTRSLENAANDASVRDLRVHLSHSRRLLETHAARENHFLTEFRRHLKKAVRGKEKQS
jgi:hypothetical protein